MKYIFYLTFLVSVFSFLDLYIFETPQILLQHPLMIISLIVLFYKYKTIPIAILIFVLITSVVGVFNIIYNNNSFALFSKVLSGIVLNFLFYFYFIKHENNNIEIIIKVYCYGAFVSACLIFIQILSFAIDFKYGYDVSLLGIRLNIENGQLLPSALFSEPAHYAAGMAPAIFISTYNIITRDNKFISLLASYTITVASILTLSSTCYIIIVLSIALVALNYKTFSVLLFSIFFCFITVFILYNNVDKFKTRVDDSIDVFINKKVRINKDINYNASTMEMFNNMDISFKNFKEHPLFGTGLGSHYFAHSKYTIFDKDIWWSNLNKEDAGSLFLRLMSEAGLLGILSFIYFISKHYVYKSKSKNENNWIISSAILTLFMANLIRQGNYMIYGFIAFLIMYYAVYKNNMFVDENSNKKL